MPNVSITDLPAAGPLTGTELVPVVQNGVTVKTTTFDISTSPNNTQSFITVVNEPSLPNSRYFSVGIGLGVLDGGSQSFYRIVLNGTSASLEGATSGVIVKDASTGTVLSRSIATSGAGLTVYNSDGVSGNPTIALTGLPASLANLNAYGFVTMPGNGTVVGRFMTSVPSEITIGNADGVSSNPVFGLADTAITPGTYGTGTQVPQFTVDAKGRLIAASNINITGSTNVMGGAANQMLYQSAPNTTSFVSAPTSVGQFLRWNGSSFIWSSLPGTGTVTSVDVSGGTTGLTTSGGPITISGTITLGGTLNVDSGGTGANTLTGYVKGNGTAAMTASATVPTTDLSGVVDVPTGGTGAATLTGYVKGNGTAPMTAAATVPMGDLSGTLSVGSGGTGATTLTGYVKGSGTSPFTASSTVPTTDLSGVVDVPTGGTGAATLTGYVKGNGTAAMTASATIPTSDLSGTISNSQLANSSITVGSTSISLGNTSLTLAGLTSVTLTQDPTNALDVATKQYVDAVAEGLHIHESCAAATTDTLANLTGGSVTYDNGVAGVGATLTLGNALTTLDGYTLQNTNRVLVKNEANSAHNGIYTWATGGTVLTRAADFNTPVEIASGDFTFITNGTSYGDTGWVQIEPVAVVGTDPIVFVQFSGAGTYTAGTGLTLAGSQFSITNTGVSASTYGSASSVPVFAVNAQGQLTSVTNTNIAIDAAAITSGTISSSLISGSYSGITGVGTITAGTWNATTISTSYGGTGLTSYTTGDIVYYNTGTALSKLAIGAVDSILTSNGTAPVWTAASSISIGTATNVAGGSTGSILYQSAASTTTSLSLGTLGDVLVAGATAPAYAAQSTLDVGNSANVTTTAVTANATYYVAIMPGFSGSNGVCVDTDMTYNPSSNTLTTGTLIATAGISGGTF